MSGSSPMICVFELFEDGYPCGWLSDIGNSNMKYSALIYFVNIALENNVSINHQYADVICDRHEWHSDKELHRSHGFNNSMMNGCLQLLPFDKGVARRAGGSGIKLINS